MTAAAVCDYCLHRSSGGESRCPHCGAPLRELAAAAAAVERVVADATTPTPGVAAEAPKSGATDLLALWVQWRVALAGLAALLAVVFTVIRCCSPDLPAIGQPTAHETLPESLRAASNCGAAASQGASVQCVIPAGDTLLFGSITGGRDLSFSMQTEDSTRLAEDIRRWRAAGPSVISDGSVFVAIGPSAAVWFADTRTGVRVETGAFTSRAGAQAFLIRSGLTA